jgi:hypothetical protein
VSSPKAAVIVSARFTPTAMKTCCSLARRFLTGVTNIIVRGDLMQRTMFVGLTPVSNDERVADEDFSAVLTKERPAILGALLSGLSVGLRRLPTLKPSSLPRLAAFAKWGMACETAFWPEGTFVAAYQGNMATAVDDVIDSDKAVSTLRAFMAERGRWGGTVTDLLGALVAFVKLPLRAAERKLDTAMFEPKAQSRAEANFRDAREKVRETLGKGWPGNPRALSGRLKKAGPALRQIGVAIDWPTRHGAARVITITSNTVDLWTVASQSSHASQVIEQSQSRANQNKDLRKDESDEQGRARDVGGTHPGRKGLDVASHDKRLILHPNATSSVAWDRGDANPADLSSLQQCHSGVGAAPAESNTNFQSSLAPEEEHGSDPDDPTASAREAEIRPMWRARL